MAVLLQTNRLVATVSLTRVSTRRYKRLVVRYRRAVRILRRRVRRLRTALQDARSQSNDAIVNVLARKLATTERSLARVLKRERRVHRAIVRDVVSQRLDGANSPDAVQVCGRVVRTRSVYH